MSHKTVHGLVRHTINGNVGGEAVGCSGSKTHEANDVELKLQTGLNDKKSACIVHNRFVIVITVVILINLCNTAGTKDNWHSEVDGREWRDDGLDEQSAIATREVTANASRAHIHIKVVHKAITGQSDGQAVINHPTAFHAAKKGIGIVNTSKAHTECAIATV